jgi:predicted Zn-dependent protease with MMP-like domain
VVDVPPADAFEPDGPGSDADPVPLGRVIPATGEEPARVVVYRRPIEARAAERAALVDLVHDVVVDQVASLLGLDPDVVDPPYDDDE